MDNIQFRKLLNYCIAEIQPIALKKKLLTY